jgi:hypothetical protein
MKNSANTVLFCVAATVGLWLLPVNVALSQQYSFTTLAGLAGGGGCSDGRGSAARFNWPNGVHGEFIK